jgi:NAD(P)-dependent dehydrogenase (short-subunit alcohol dehydrogenase family)
MPTLSSNKQLLLIGASRGLGFALAEEYLKRGWHVVATERKESIPNLANTMDAQAGTAGLQYLNYLGQTVPW